MSHGTLQDSVICWKCNTANPSAGKAPGSQINCLKCGSQIAVLNPEMTRKVQAVPGAAEIPAPPPVVKIFCTSCSSKIEVTGHTPGSSLSCPACQTSLKVPQLQLGVDASLKLFCTSCNSKLDLTGHKGGAKIPCPSCQTALMVPQVDRPAAPSESSAGKVRVNCPHCSSKLDASGWEPLRKVDCPNCRKSFILPKRFGKFLLEEQIARNASFTIYRATDLALARECAVKILAADLMKNPRLVDALARISGQGALVTHPSVVPVYGWNEEEGQAFIVSQFMVSSAAAALQRNRGPLPLHQACTFIRQAALGLEAAARNGLYHGNICPTNLMIDKEGLAKLSDFSIGSTRLNQAADAWPDEIAACVQPMYVSPEMARMGRNPDPVRGDIFSLGATFYELLTGNKPFLGRTFKEILRERQDRLPPAPAKSRPEIPAALSDYVLKMMAIEPEARPALPREIAEFLEPYTQAPAAPVTPTPVAAPPAPAAAPPAAAIAPPSAPDAEALMLMGKEIPFPAALAHLPKDTRMGIVLGTVGVAGLLALLLLGAIFSGPSAPPVTAESAPPAPKPKVPVTTGPKTPPVIAKFSDFDTAKTASNPRLAGSVEEIRAYVRRQGIENFFSELLGKQQQEAAVLYLYVTPEFSAKSQETRVRTAESIREFWAMRCTENQVMRSKENCYVCLVDESSQIVGGSKLNAAAEVWGVEGAAVIPEPVPAPAAAAGSDAPLPLAIALSKRPRPADLKIDLMTPEFLNYVADLPSGTARSREVERLRQLAAIRPYLQHALEMAPWEGELIHAQRGQSKLILGADAAGLRLGRSGAAITVEAKWQDFGISEYIKILESFAQARREAAAGSPLAAKADAAGGEDLFRAALLADWYGLSAEALRLSEAAVKLQPALASPAKALIPSQGR
ncbi:MAG: hypothetical protein RL095_3049 [Verrucomicrobiota bacterium]|jgi:serine/threonine-protein kinase